MAASLDRRAAISASTFCRSALMSVAPAAPFVFGWPKAFFSSRKSNWPWQADAGANLTNTRRRGVGMAGIDRGAENTNLRWPVRPGHDIAAR
jgi:hypothetical protein